MYRKFCLSFFAVTIVTLTFIAGFNILVDPYEIWEKVKIVGFNMYPTKAEQLDRMQKPIHFLHMENKPEAVFLGNSQVLYGMDMDVFQELSGESAYNFSMWGATLYEQRCALEHVLALDDNLKDVYIGLLMAEFVQGDHHPLHKAEDFFVNEEPQYGKSYVIPNTISRTVFSWDATKESVKTVLDNYRNRWPNPCYMPSGKRYDDSLLRSFEDDQWKFNRTVMLMARNGQYRGAELNSDSFDELQKMLDLCRERGIRVHLYIPVVHARHMELLADVWEVYEDWKRRLICMAPVMDFTDYNYMTMSVAKSGMIGEDTNSYFWDALHFKPHVGTAMMESLLGKKVSVEYVNGVLLTDDSIEEQLATLRNKRKKWEEKHKDSVEEVRYYSGFSPIPPQELRALAGGKKAELSLYATGREVQVGSDEWRTYVSEADRDPSLPITLQQVDRLYIMGSSLSSVDGEKVFYGVLHDAFGKKYYARAEQRQLSIPDGFLGLSERREEGFCLKIPVWDVPFGGYELSFIEIDREGKVYESKVMRTVEIVE